MSPVLVVVVKNINIVMEFKIVLKKIGLVLLLVLGTVPFLHAQKGTVKVEADSMLKIITRNRVWSRPDKITGYRVLMFTGSRNGAEKVANDFRTQFPDQPVLLKWDEPNFKVVGGLFYNRKDAKAFRKKCSRKFPMLIIVNELVELPPVDEKPRKKKDSK